MSVILMLVMFTIFLAIDYFRHEKRAQEPVESKEEIAPVPRLQPEFVSGFQLPENCRYHPGHTWVLQESPTLVRVGLDDFAARLVGRIDSMVLPKRGQWVRQGQKFVTLFRDDAKADLVSPIEGEVTQVNEEVMTDRSLPNRDPYGRGWLVSVISPDAQTNLRNLLGGKLARLWMSEAGNRLFAKMPSLAGAVAQDGGLAIHDLTAQLPGQKWADITKEFFVT